MKKRKIYNRVKKTRKRKIRKIRKKRIEREQSEIERKEKLQKIILDKKIKEKYNNIKNDIGSHFIIDESKF